MTTADEGHAIHESVFDHPEMVHILGALDEAELARTKAGARHVLAIAAVRALASDSRLLSIASRYVGVKATPYRATLFDKSQAANWLVSWHQDTALPIRSRVDRPGWGPWSIKGGVLHAIAPASALERLIALRIHLDDSTHANGPLRVLPGSHAHGVLGHKDIEELTAVVPSVACLAPRGGVVAMRPLTVHASSKARNGERRRVLHVEYAGDLTLDSGIQLAVG
jgi:ectoine hydroxylase-related dioxygenase (phytanoyl-CoA dioxygenase family)